MNLKNIKILDENNTRRKNAEDDLETAQKDLNSAIRALEEEVRATRYGEGCL
jgi:outer membrane murein-binding lipoprotein Lpp